MTSLAVPALIVVAGTTATGKTALSLGIADALASKGVTAEIISADSRQVYRGMDIGTAKVTAEDRARVPHRGLDLVDPDQPFSVSDLPLTPRRPSTQSPIDRKVVGRTRRGVGQTSRRRQRSNSA